MSTKSKNLAIVVGEVLLGLYTASLFHLTGEALVTALMGVAAMLLLFYGFS